MVIPCLNEAASISRCVHRARDTLGGLGWEGEVIVVDNASDDGSAEQARDAGALVVHEPRRGYGSAYLAGFAAARGDYIVMADADLTYDFADIPRFVSELDGGADLVMGDRMGGIQPGAMPWLHRYVGNPVLTGVLNLFFRTGVHDAHCGMRAVRREVLPRLDLRTTGMEFASEMIIRAGKERLAIAEIPIHYHPREGRSKLSSWRDGWRHLRFLLVHSPTWLFIVPGALMALLGTLVALTVLLPDRDPGPGVGPALDGGGRATDDRRYAGTRSGPLRTCLRHLLHGREGSVVRPHARPFPARARVDGGRSRAVPGRRAGGNHRRHLGGPGLRCPLGGAAGSACRGAHDRGYPDLLLVLPCQHHRLAPAPLDMAVRAVLAAGFALLLLAVGVTLAQTAPRQAGSNHVPEIEEAVKLRGDGRHCQPRQTLPEGAAAVRLLVGTYGRPAPGVRVTARTRAGESVTTGRRPAGGEEGRLEIPVATR